MASALMSNIKANIHTEPRAFSMDITRLKKATGAWNPRVSLVEVFTTTGDSSRYRATYPTDVKCPDC